MSQGRPCTILCIDDEPLALNVRKLLLEHSGYTVFTALNSTQALELFDCQMIDLVISDHLLPDMTGAELTLEMKSRKPFVPIMLFSGVPEVLPGTAHADLFLSKAGGPVELLEKLADLLRSNRISEGDYFAEIRCDKRFQPEVWHYTIQRHRSAEIVSWNQFSSEKTAIDSAKSMMRELNQRHKNRENES